MKNLTDSNFRNWTRRATSPEVQKTIVVQWIQWAVRCQNSRSLPHRGPVVRIEIVEVRFYSQIHSPKLLSELPRWIRVRLRGLKSNFNWTFHNKVIPRHWIPELESLNKKANQWTWPKVSSFRSKDRPWARHRVNQTLTKTLSVKSERHHLISSWLLS